MTKKCTNVIVGWLVRCDAIEEKDRELYQYAVYSVFLSTYPLLFATCFGVVIGEVERSIAIIIPFAVIRKFSGGYHAKNSRSCFLWSSEYSDAKVHPFRKFRAPFSGKAEHTFPE